MSQRYSPQQLQRIFEHAAGGGLWVPQNRRPAPYVGPAFAVYLRYSDLFPEKGDAGGLYWQLLQELPVVNALGILALVNDILAMSRSDQEARQILNQQFLEASVADLVRRNGPEAPAFGVVFHRLGNLVAMHDLLLYGANRTSTTEAPITQVGMLALCANDFVERDPVHTAAPTNLELATLVIRTWDIHNPRELAYAMARMHAIFTEILSGDEPSIVQLRDRIGMNNLAIDGLTLLEFLAIAFALFAYGQAVGKEGMSRVVLEPASFFRDFSRAEPLLNCFLAGRALTIEELADRLAGGAPRTPERFQAEARNKSVLNESLTVFRQHPLLRIEGGRVIILDLQFLTDLVTTGVYWLLFDSLPQRSRETFKELWGRCFEIYVTELLRHFYPLNSQILSNDVAFPNGQIDALLDFGTDVFVVEIKSSLLTEAAKRSGDATALAADIERKFIRNERGAPKAVVQLARAAEAVLRGDVATATRPRRVYPVLITDEPGCECLAFNAYLNEKFQEETPKLTGIRLLTVMSINECEEILPYVTANAFSWAELCETRFEGRQTAVWSVHQAAYDLRHERNIPVQRNKYLLNRFEAIYQRMLQTYGVDKIIAGV